MRGSWNSHSAETLKAATQDDMRRLTMGFEHVQVFGFLMHRLQHLSAMPPFSEPKNSPAAAIAAAELQTTPATMGNFTLEGPSEGHTQSYSQADRARSSQLQAACVAGQVRGARDTRGQRAQRTPSELSIRAVVILGRPASVPRASWCCGTPPQLQDRLQKLGLCTCAVSER